MNWKEIANSLPGRSNKDCRKRYLNEMAGTLKKVRMAKRPLLLTLLPMILEALKLIRRSIKGPWSKEEDALLIKLVEKQHSPSWVAVSHAMGTRNADRGSPPLRWTQPAVDDHR